MVQLMLTAVLAVFTGGDVVQANPREASTLVPPAMSAVLQTDHPALRASLERLWRGSRSWRDTLTALSATGRRAIVLTPDQVVVREPASGENRQFEPDVLAEASPVSDERGFVSAVLVVINLPLIEAIHERRGSLPGEMEVDLDRVLAHEVYGHALPYLMDGTLAGRCPDPEPGQRAADACAIRRENVIRAELGMSRRTDSGLQGLTLAFRGRH
jgi:hypothetical protein